MSHGGSLHLFWTQTLSLSPPSRISLPDTTLLRPAARTHYITTKLATSTRLGWVWEWALAWVPHFLCPLLKLVFIQVQWLTFPLTGTCNRPNFKVITHLQLNLNRDSLH